MTYQVTDIDGTPVDAHFDVEGSDVVFLARGGSRNSGGEANRQYGPGLRALLSRIRGAGLVINEVLVDSSVVQGLPKDQRRILTDEEGTLPDEELFTLLSRRMRDVRPKTTKPPRGGNSTKRIRICIVGGPADAELAGVLGGVRTDRSLRALNRLPVSELSSVESRHIWGAVQRVLRGEVDDAYGPATDYDLMTDDGALLPPKMVFGMAASEALGFHVLPEYFVSGESTACFAALREAGYEVVRKGEVVAPRSEALPPPSVEDREWTEGDRRVVVHLRRERSRSLVKAKKNSFTSVHGRLFCESCGFEPGNAYEDGLGEACIEVHHRRVSVAEMDDGHVTRLEDLECLCANCHRVVHARMRDADATRR